MGLAVRNVLIISGVAVGRGGRGRLRSYRVDNQSVTAEAAGAIYRAPTDCQGVTGGGVARGDGEF